MTPDDIQKLHNATRFLGQMSRMLGRYGLRLQQTQAHKHWVFLRDLLEQHRSESVLAEMASKTDEPEPRKKKSQSRKVYSELLGDKD